MRGRRGGHRGPVPRVPGGSLRGAGPAGRPLGAGAQPRGLRRHPRRQRPRHGKTQSISIVTAIDCKLCILNLLDREFRDFDKLLHL